MPGEDITALMGVVVPDAIVRIQGRLDQACARVYGPVLDHPLDA